MSAVLAWLVLLLTPPATAQAAPFGCLWNDGGVIVFSAEACSKDQQPVRVCQGGGRTWFVAVGTGC